MPTTNSLYGLFPGPNAAERAMNELRAAGIHQDKILVMSSEPYEEYSFGQTDQKTFMPWIAVLGGLIGGTGGLLLAWYTQTAYPLITGGMALVTVWPTGIVTYEVTMLSAIVATVITLLVTAKLPQWKQPVYDAEISHGKILIGVVDPSDDARADLETRLRRAGAEKVKATGGLESASSI